jgi:uncharacterized repeat protein (TIGR03803 family)
LTYIKAYIRQDGGGSHSPQHFRLLWLACAIAAIGVAPGLALAASETLLHTFASPPQGANPYAGVICDSAGSLYGTTFDGGTFGLGVVYKVNSAGQETVLHNFKGGSDGKNPRAGVVRDPAGNFYGTTYEGGTYSAGTVYKVDTTGHETVLYSFTGGSDGGYPWGGVTLDATGNLYGTTELGGAQFRGVVFKLDTVLTETPLYSFTGGSDGSEPTAGVILDSAGNIYGTTYYGGTAGVGVVFKVDTSGHETVLYSFTGGSDGGYPWAGVVSDSAGNLYGTTNNGGTEGVGVVYKVDTTGHETPLHSFGGAGGSSPNAGVIVDSAGNLYGTTYSGGSSGGWGVVYKLSAAGHETVLYTFMGGADGAYPSWAGVIRDSAGNFYGTTGNGGTGNAGVVFKLSASRQETVLCSFPSSTDGGNPYGGVIRDSSGNIYGATSGGGTDGYGIVYKLAAGHETVLYSFTGGADGGQPRAGVVRDSNGNLYGTTYQGGANGWGAVFKLDASGQESVCTVLHWGPMEASPNRALRWIRMAISLGQPCSAARPVRVWCSRWIQAAMRPQFTALPAEPMAAFPKQV